ncbi:MAG: TonB-dependent hemoglobin/transferrin/lactoferrin family receptor [Pseudomonadota bacterium]
MTTSLKITAGSALGFALVFAGAQPALANEASSEQASPDDEGRITVTATRTPVLVEEAPATITIIDAEEIADQLATDVRDLVRFEPGVTVRRAPARFGAALSTTGRARNEDFVIRGIGGNRVLIQVDGIRSPQGFSFGAQDAGRGGYTDVSLVKSVEILRGPSSALYGSDGLAGAISFTTSDPVDLLGADTFGGFVRGHYSSEDNEFAETAVLAAQGSNVSGMIAYTRRDFNELENQAETGGTGSSRTIPNPQDGESNAVLGKLVWNNGEHRLRLTGEWIETEVFTNVLTGLGPVFFGPPIPGTQAWDVTRLEANDSTERVRGSLDWTYTGEDDDFIEYAFVTAYYQNGEDNQFAEEDRDPAADRTRLNTFENEVYGFAAEARSTFDTAGLSHTMAIGGDVSWTRQEGLRDGTVPPFGEVFPTRAFPATDYTLGGIFLADEIAIGGGTLTLFPAVRFDFYDLNPTDDPLLPTFAGSDQSDSRVSPKVGATLKLANDLLLFANYAQGFLAPTPSQVNNFFENLAFGYTSAPNPDLGPETSESWEVGARYVGDIFSLQVVGFQGDYDDFISQQVVGGSFTPQDPAVFQFVNFTEVEIDGFEVKASMNLDNGISARLAIAYANGDIINADGSKTPLDTVDPFNLVAGLGYRDPQGRFGAELILTHNGRKDANEVERAPDGTDLFIRPDQSTIFDLTAFVEVTDALKLRAGLFNLFDEKYAVWSDVRGLSVDNAAIFDAFTRPGRNVSVSASFQF